VGARPYQRIGIVESNRQIHGPLRPKRSYPTSQRLQPMPVQLTIILDSSARDSYWGRSRDRSRIGDRSKKRSKKMVGTRSRLIRFSVSDGYVRCTASDDCSTPARPWSHVWNASVDVLRRTRRNADTIRGAAPDVTSGRPAAVRVGARPYQRIGIVESNRQIHGPLRCAYSAATWAPFAATERFIRSTRKASATASTAKIRKQSK
jgi:hypothetical protein